MLAITPAQHPDLFARSGQASALVLAPNTTAEVRHITGCIAWPTGEPVQDIRLAGDRLMVRGELGAKRALPIRGDFLGL